MWVIFDVGSVCSFKHIMLFSLLLTHSFINPHSNCRSNQSSFLTLCHYSTLTYFLIYNAVAKWYSFGTYRSLCMEYRIPIQCDKSLSLVDTALSFHVSTYCYLLMVCNQSICPDMRSSFYRLIAVYLQAKMYCEDCLTSMFWWVCRKLTFLLINRIIPYF